jgi:hypothetical protein
MEAFLETETLLAQQDSPGVDQATEGCGANLRSEYDDDAEAVISSIPGNCKF